jgi:hypothetical protein
VTRLQERIRDAQPALATEVLLQQLAANLERRSAPVTLGRGDVLPVSRSYLHLFRQM